VATKGERTGLFDAEQRNVRDPAAHRGVIGGRVPQLRVTVRWRCRRARPWGCLAAYPWALDVPRPARHLQPGSTRSGRGATTIAALTPQGSLRAGAARWNGVRQGVGQLAA
jgi:hypothetical protein